MQVGRAQGCECLSYSSAQSGYGLRKGGVAIHIIQRVQCLFGVRVTVQALHAHLPCLLHRRPCPSTLQFLPRLGVGGSLAVFCQFCFVSASAVLPAVQPLLGPCL